MITKDYSIKLLNDIKSLEDNWNFNNAKRIPDKLIIKCSDIVNKLTYFPFIVPTDNGNIKFEFENDNLDYLEVIVGIDKIFGFVSLKNGSKYNFYVNNNDYVCQLNRIIENFIK